MFVCSTPYVNTACADSQLLYVENRRLRLKDKKCLTIGIMTSMVTESFLLSSCESGPRNSPYQVHKITIAPFDQDMRRDVSMWGQLFQFHVIAGMVSPLGISFTTRGEGKGESWKNGLLFSVVPPFYSHMSLSVSAFLSVEGQIFCAKACIVIFCVCFQRCLQCLAFI
jgi:hypothetical protein